MRTTILLFTLAFVLNACNVENIRLYPSFEESTILTIDEETDFYEELIIPSSDIYASITELDLDDSGTIEDINIEGIWIVITPLTNNTAQWVTLNLSIKVDEYDQEWMLNNYTITIPDKTTTIYLASDLIKSGVHALNTQMYKLIVSQSTFKDIEFEISGYTTPTNSTINVSIELFIQSGLVYHQTI
jgi:hypothetical protein